MSSQMYKFYQFIRFSQITFDLKIIFLSSDTKDFSPFDKRRPMATCRKPYFAETRFDNENMNVFIETFAMKTCAFLKRIVKIMNNS